jgi:hypothetical protein
MINWHDRSIAPERLWERFYLKLLDELKSRGAWFASAGQAAAWFRMRRSAAFESVTTQSGEVSFRISATAAPGLPGLRVRVHLPAAQSPWEAAPAGLARFKDFAFRSVIEKQLKL